MSPVLQLCRCGAIVERKPCAQCRRADNARRKQKNTQQGKTGPQWRRIREAVLKRDGYRCVHCGYGGFLQAHRKPEFGSYHDWQLDGYETLCRNCHGVVDGARSHG
jgi:5-methylcytosine-specific restriction endonuclease McrA